jgi:hypothetical protein
MHFLQAATPDYITGAIPNKPCILPVLFQSVLCYTNSPFLSITGAGIILKKLGTIELKLKM